MMITWMLQLNAADAMARCQLVHDLRQCPVQVGSPQTQPQRDQVTRVIKKLISQANTLRRTVSDVNVLPGDFAGGIEDHSPRNPSAHAITMSLTQGHGHFPIGSPGVPTAAHDGVQNGRLFSPSAAEMNSAPIVVNATSVHCDAAVRADGNAEEDPWSVDIVPGYEDVDVDSDTDDHVEKNIDYNNRSIRFGDTEVVNMIGNETQHTTEVVTTDIDVVFENLNEEEVGQYHANGVEVLVEEEDGEYSVRGATLVESSTAVGSPTPPGSLQPSSTIGGGVRSYRNQKEGH
jgi:hypothetical protein